MGSVITDIDGRLLTNPSNFTRLSRLVRNTPVGLSRCEFSDRVLGQRAIAKGRPAVEVCHSCGLLDASAPIVVGGKHVANWLIGQVKTRTMNRSDIVYFAREIGADAEDMLAAFDEITLSSAERFAKIINLLWCLAQEISAMGYSNLRLAHEIEKQKKIEDERRQAELTLRTFEEKAAKAFENCADLIVISSLAKGRFVEANAAFFNLTGYAREEIIGRTTRDIWAIKGADQRRTLVRALLNKGSVRGMEFSLRLKSGEIRVGLCSAETMELHGEKHIVWVWHDITERKQAEEHLAYLSAHDVLTGLYNRRTFEQTLEQLASTGQRAAIIVCDVDGLKLINDTLGHAAGDELLKAAANLLGRVVGSQGLVARTGGDEFAIVLPDCLREQAETVCQALRVEAVHYNMHDHSLYLSLSVGMAVPDAERTTLFELFKEADNNMYREKLHRGQSARSAMVQTVMKLLEARDFITEGHAERLQAMVAKLGKAINLTEHRLADLRLLAQFHDIGKVGIPDRILFKPGPLTAEEKTEMERHSEIGHRIAQSSHDLAHIADWILKHHEWWDGSGYPLGLKGEDIPLECRVLAIADAYDAMTSDRPYRSAMPRNQALAELKRCAGTQFDPELTAVFTEMASI